MPIHNRMQLKLYLLSRSILFFLILEEIRNNCRFLNSHVGLRRLRNIKPKRFAENQQNFVDCKMLAMRGASYKILIYMQIDVSLSRRFFSPNNRWASNFQSFHSHQKLLFARRFRLLVDLSHSIFSPHSSCAAKSFVGFEGLSSNVGWFLAVAAFCPKRRLCERGQRAAFDISLSEQLRNKTSAPFQDWKIPGGLPVLRAGRAPFYCSACCDVKAALLLARPLATSGRMVTSRPNNCGLRLSRSISKNREPFQ